ncbi:hypothetical protein BCR35DRAFT_334413 [Leucosporidium creatinivorum]|uniref:Uncharacterized protein n=1 Tax=Leucosporidium creatinivorum TaxID=106004 RepID=A0A1Y2E936_9BASI|nr:hypothetical protein BCR35DRAFT_334413 [Leucosporidium creatinivorum]
MQAQASAAFRDLTVSYLAPHPPLDELGRLPSTSIPLYTALSTKVALLLSMGDAPFLAPVNDEHAWMIVELLERDEKLNERVRESQRYRYFQTREQERFLNTFGKEPAVHRPLVKLCLNVTVFDYVVEVCRRLLLHCTRLEDVDRLIFVGERDWESLDAWERSKVILAARDYTRKHLRLFHLAGSAHSSSPSKAPLSSRVCDAAWGQLDYTLELPRLTLTSSAAGWKHAFRIREGLVHLFLASPSIFRLPAAKGPQEEIIKLLGESLQQGTVQSEPERWTAEGVPNGVETKMAFLRSLTGVGNPLRPFAELMAHPMIEPQLGQFVKNTASKMVHSATRLEQARKGVYLCGRWWSRLDPLQKAWGVLEAKEYVDWIKSAAPVRPAQPRAPAPSLADSSSGSALGGGGKGAEG